MKSVSHVPKEDFEQVLNRLMEAAGFIGNWGRSSQSKERVLKLNAEMVMYTPRISAKAAKRIGYFS